MGSSVSATDSGLPRSAWLAWAFLVFIIPFQLHYNYILNVFYQSGASYTDGGVFAHLVWHKGWRLMPPGSYTPYTFFATHFTPFLLLLSQLSFFLPVHRVEYYAFVVATIYASLGLALFYAFYCALIVKKHWQIAGLAVLSIAFAFNNIIMSGAWIVHFEYAIPLGIFLFMVHFVRRSWAWAGFFFVFTLSLREDSGFHIIAVLGVLAAVRYWEKRSFAAIKPELYFMAAAFAYSVLALGLIDIIKEGHRGSNFIMVYSGEHPYSHLTWRLLWYRLQTIFKIHIEIWLGFYVVLFWAKLRHNPYLAIAFIANIPWFLLNWTAASVSAGPMRSYYAFPFVLSLGWPILAAICRYGVPIPRTAVRETLLLQTLLIVIGLVQWNDYAGQLEFGPSYAYGTGTVVVQQATANRELIHTFITQFNNGAGDLGKVMLDDGLLSLVQDSYHGKPVLKIDAKQPVDTLIYMGHPDNPDRNVIEVANQNVLYDRYCLLGTTICIITNRTPQQLGTFSALLSKR